MPRLSLFAAMLLLSLPIILAFPNTVATTLPKFASNSTPTSKGLQQTLRGWWGDRMDGVRDLVNSKVDDIITHLRPQLEMETRVLVNQTEFDFISTVPEIIRKPLGEILGIYPEEPRGRDHGMLNPIVRALDGKYEEMYLKIKKMLSFQVQDIMEDTVQRIINGTLRGLKTRFHMKKGDPTRLNKRWGPIQNIVRRQVDLTLLEVYAEIRPEIHTTMLIVIGRIRKATIEPIRKIVDWFLPDSLKISPIPITTISHPSSPPKQLYYPGQFLPLSQHVLLKLKQILHQFVDTMHSRIVGTVENLTLNLEFQIMCMVEVITKEAVSVRIPFGLYTI